jgi:hypothetical protein
MMAIDGSDGVVLGVEKPTRSIPVLAGFTPPPEYERPARWQRPVAPDAGLGGTEVGGGDLLDLAGGRAFAAYADLHKTHHLIAVSAANGKTLWDVKMPEMVWMLQASKTRVYVGGLRRLDVLEAATGRLLGTCGASSPR